MLADSPKEVVQIIHYIPQYVLDLLGNGVERSHLSDMDSPDR